MNIFERNMTSIGINDSLKKIQLMKFHENYLYYMLYYIFRKICIWLYVLHSEKVIIIIYSMFVFVFGNVEVAFRLFIMIKNN